MSQNGFSQINKSTTESFNQQRQVIKDICQGKRVLCSQCQLPLEMVGPKNKRDKRAPGIYCHKGCTSIELEFEQE